MIKNKINIKKVAIPANLTEVFALLATIGGLCIAIFLAELPIRLIGVCVAALGAVGYFMLITQRLSEAVNYRQMEVSQPTQFRTTVKKDGESKRVIFDDYEDSFGCEDNQNRETTTVAEHTIEKLQFKQEIGELSSAEDVRKKIERHFADEQPAELPSAVQVRKRYADPEPDIANIQPNIYDDIDAVSEVRIVGRKPGVGSSAMSSSNYSSASAPKNDNIAANSAGKTASKTTSLLGQRPTVAMPQPVATLAADTQKPLAVRTEQQAEVSSVFEHGIIAQNEQFATALPAETSAAQMIETVSCETDVAVEEYEPLPSKAEHKFENECYTLEDKDTGHKRTVLNIPAIDFFEEIPLITQNEPRKELDYLLQRVLMVIRSVAAARTAVFLWVDHDRQRLVLESYISDVASNIIQQKKLPLGSDVVSQIARSGRPEILTEIKPAAELDLIPYYSLPSGTLSFIGVPVFYNNSVIGILCADSTEPDVYDTITVGFFGHFTKLISGLVHSYTDKYDLMQATRALEAITQFRSLVSASQPGVEYACTALLEAASKTVDYSTLGIVVYDARINEWKVMQTIGRTENTPGSLGGIVNLDKSLAGYTIRHCKSNLVAPMFPGYLRSTESEDPLDEGFFASVPLKSFSHNYGALFVEGGSPSITAQDLSILEVLGEQTGLIIEQLRFNDMLSSMSLVNETRGILNPTAFRQRINEELQRALDFSASVTLCLVQLDKYVALDSSEDAAEVILQNIIELIRNQVKSYDIIGELDSSTIALGLVGQKEQKVQLWAERLRREIASTVVQINNRRFSVTVSFGIAEAVESDSPETLLNNAKDALQVSLGRTNSVTVFG